MASFNMKVYHVIMLTLVVGVTHSATSGDKSSALRFIQRDEPKTYKRKIIDNLDNFTSPRPRRIVCYYTNWSQYRPGQGKFTPESISSAASLCTHIHYAFAKIENGELKPFEWNDPDHDGYRGNFRLVTDLKKQHPGLKVLLSVGGWNLGSRPFSKMVRDEASRRKFILSAMKLLRDYNFDGLDIDWEYPTQRDAPVPGDKYRFTQLLRETKELFNEEVKKDRQINENGDLGVHSPRPRIFHYGLSSGESNRNEGRQESNEYFSNRNFEKKGHLNPHKEHKKQRKQSTNNSRLMVTAALAAGEKVIMEAYEWAEIYKYLDYGVLMSYDFHGAWDNVTGENAPLYNAEDDPRMSVNASSSLWTSLGFPAEKLVVGVVSYGRGFVLKSTAQSKLGSPVRGPSPAQRYTRQAGIAGFYEICLVIQDGGVVTRLEEQEVPYVVKGNLWVGYDDVTSLQEKVKFVRQGSLGGVSLWSLDTDDFTGSVCGLGSYPLLRTLV